MKFKIDTKEKIVIFCPEEALLNANLSGNFISTVTALPALKGRNLILDLQFIQKMDVSGIEAILTVYRFMYDNHFSCAITGLIPAYNTQLSAAGPATINIAPTMAEAIDLIMMEELERELLDGLE